MAYQFGRPDENRFKLGQIVVDHHVHRPMAYIGCSDVARALEGAYKFVLQSKTNGSYYISYLSPDYVDQNVKAKGPLEFRNLKDLKFIKELQEDCRLQDRAWDYVTALYMFMAKELKASE